MHTPFEPRDLTLRDGRTVHIRAVLPNDEAEILQGFDRLGPDARYMRFHTARRHMDVERLRTYLAQFPRKGAAIAATVPATDGIDIVGIASFVVEGEDDASCEFGITIAEPWHNAGLGHTMMELLVEEARRRGLAMMRGMVLAENRGMLDLAARLGFEAVPDPDDYSVRIVTLALR